MELSIGKNIKRLRLEKGLTQEQLAALLAVSTAAVSKWEAKNTYPDITMLFPIAQIFGVSIDDLLGFDEAKAEADIDRILAEYKQMNIDGRFAEMSELINDARREYPHDYRIMVKYMWDKADGNAGNDFRTLLENKDELSQICDCILDGCTQDDLRAEAINMKAKLLHAAGDTDGALEMLSRLPAWHAPMIKEQLFSKDTPEWRFWNKRNCYGLMDTMSVKLARIIRFDVVLTATQKAEHLERIAQAFDDMSQCADLEFFCIGAQAIYAVLADMLTWDNASVADVIRIREKQFSTMERIMALAEADDVVRELVMSTYNTDSMTSWLLNRLSTLPHTQFAKLREEVEYMKMLSGWEERCRREKEPDA